MITKNYQYKNQWLNKRAKSISASDAPVIMGTSKYNSKIGLVEQKLGIREPKDLSGVSPVAFGTECEHMFGELAQEHISKFAPGYDEEKQIEWSPDTFDDPGEYCIQQHDEHEWATCTADYFGYDTHDAHLFAPVEVKTGPIGKFLQVPDIYYDQIQWQLFVTDRPFGYLAAMTLEDDFIRQEWLNYEGHRVHEALLEYVRNKFRFKVFLIEADVQRQVEMFEKCQEAHIYIESQRVAA